MRRLAAGTLAFVLLWPIACGRRGVLEDAWQQIDLWERPGAVIEPVPDRPRPLRGVHETLAGRGLRVLDPVVGETLAWRLTLGRDAFLGVRTIVLDGDCRFIVTVREPPIDGASAVDHLVFDHRQRGDRHDLYLPAPSQIDLGRWAGRTVYLLLRAEAVGEEPCRQARWGSPAVAHRGGAPVLQEFARPNVVLLGIDTLRIDALGVYGRDPTVTPAIDNFAAASDVWLDAYASANSTNPSFVSLLTGLFPKNHGVFDLTSRLAPSYLTLAEVLHDAGYHTWGVTAATHLGNNAGLSQGFDIFVGPDHGQLYAETVVNIGLTWLEQERDRPFFLWLHFFDPHIPHNPPTPYQLGQRPVAPSGFGPVDEWTPFRELGPRPFVERPDTPSHGHIDLYTGEIAYLDRQLDRFLDFLDSRSLLETTVVALVGDHGETFGERGNLFDHAGLHDDTTRVPLIVHWPGQREGRRIPGLVQHHDLFGTLLRYLDIASPEHDGHDLLELAERGRGQRHVFAQHAEKSGAMIRDRRYKYFTNRDVDLYPAGPYLYDHESDPGERRNLAGTDHPAEPELARALERWLADTRPVDPPEPVVISDEERAHLEALGYVR